jgi:excisionase family DNA binding protein
MNLKQAAGRLGIHYQTAYKLVRSGALGAVRIGGTYEISEAALARHLAERELLRRAPRTLPVPAIAPDGDARARLVDDTRAAAKATTLSALGTFETVARGLAEVVRDAGQVRVLSDDGAFLSSVAFHHWDAARRSVLAAYHHAIPLAVDEGFTGHAFSSGHRMFAPHVPQDVLRAGTRPEFVQYLDDAGLHSIVAEPVRVHGRPVGIVSCTRDYTGVPHDASDLALVEDLALLVGAAIARRDTFVAGWERRAALVDELAGRPRDADPVLADGPGIEIVLDATLHVRAANLAAHERFGDELDARARLLLGARAGVDLVGRLERGELDFHDAEDAVAGPSGVGGTCFVHRAVVRASTLEPVAYAVVANDVDAVEVPARDGAPAGRRLLEPLPTRIVPHGTRLERLRVA